MKNINITLPEIKNENTYFEYLIDYFDCFISTLSREMIKQGFTEKEINLMQLFANQGSCMATYIKNITKNANKLLDATQRNTKIKLVGIEKLSKLGI